MLATGYNLEGIEVGPYSRFLHEFMMGWFNRDYFLVDFSEIQFLKQDLLEDILDFCGLDLPRDWRKRLAAGMDPALSATYIAPLPPEERAQARAFAEALLDFHVPGAVSWYQNTRETIARRRARDGSGRARGTEELQRPPA